MIPEIGQAALLVALLLALYGSVAAGVAGARGRAVFLQSAQHAAVGVFVLVIASLLLLTYAFLTFDFSVRYVATNTNLGTPFYYRITAVWGALEGSIILWARRCSRSTRSSLRPDPAGACPRFLSLVLAVMLGVLSFFLFVMTHRRPRRSSGCPHSRRRARPQSTAEDTGMITHPVAPYLGFTGFTVPFAFAIAELSPRSHRARGEAWLTLTGGGPSSPGTS